MLASEFLDKLRKEYSPFIVLPVMMDMLVLLDYYDSESCSVLAGKLRNAMDEANEAEKKEIPITDIIDIVSLGDKLDVTGHEVYAIQITERLEEVARITGRSIPEVKNKVREYKANR